MHISSYGNIRRTFWAFWAANVSAAIFYRGGIYLAENHDDLEISLDFTRISSPSPTTRAALACK